MTPDEIVRRAQQDEAALIRFLYCDNANIIRGKAATAAKLQDFLTSGIGLTVAMQGFTPTERLATQASVGPVGEIRLVPDFDTYVPLPYSPRQSSMLCDMVTLDGERWDLCPRSTLKRVLAGALSDGFEVEVGFEHEFYLLAQAEDGLQPVDHSLCFATSGMNNAAPVILDILSALELQGIEPIQYYPELGPGQQELSVEHRSALRAADEAIVVRETIRGVAHQHGLSASFAPKPFIDQAGNGSHIHLSVWRGGRNAFYDSADPLGLSSVAYGFIAGVLEHLPALLALTCPSLNSYQRLAPGMWSSAFVCYGPDNREAAIRIASPFRGREEASTNIELKAIDGSANPYLALAGIIAAGLDGVQRQLRPGEAIYTNPGALPEQERASLGIKRFPSSPIIAADFLRADAYLNDSLGKHLVDEMLAVRRSETEDLNGLEPRDLAKRYMTLY
jgi:glutamine synthetase